MTPDHAATIRHGFKRFVRQSIAIVRVSFRSKAVHFWAHLVGNFFLAVVMFVFVQLWRTVFSGAGVGSLNGFTLAEVIWYLAVAQSLGGTLSRLADDIDKEIKDGTLTYRLLRPVSYIHYHLATYLGNQVPTMALNSLIAMTVAYTAVGAIHIGVKNLAAFLVTWVMGLLLNFFLVMSVGLVGFWVEDTRPYSFLYSRLLMILGGMLIPLDMLPGVVRAVADSLPLRLIVYTPARLFVDYNKDVLVHTLWGQGAWLLGALGVCLFTYRRGVGRINAHGG